MFPWLLEEFPYLHLAPATLHNLWHKASLQLEQMSRAETDTQRQKSKAQEQVSVTRCNKEHLKLFQVAVVG